MVTKDQWAAARQLAMESLRSVVCDDPNRVWSPLNRLLPLQQVDILGWHTAPGGKVASTGSFSLSIKPMGQDEYKTAKAPAERHTVRRALAYYEISAVRTDTRDNDAAPACCAFIRKKKILGLYQPSHQWADERYSLLFSITPSQSISDATAHLLECMLPSLSHYVENGIIPVGQDTPSSASTLTARELQVLRLIVDGHSTAVIADSLNIRERTVHFHLQNSYRKLHVRNRHEAMTLARYAGLP